MTSQIGHFYPVRSFGNNGIPLVFGLKLIPVGESPFRGPTFAKPLS